MGATSWRANAGGTIRACEAPRHLAVTWEYGGDTSLLPLDLVPDTAGTGLCLTRVVADDGHWQTYGPGATGVGWDLALLGLAAHLAGQVLDEHDLAATLEGQELMRRSAQKWGAVHQAAALARRTLKPRRDAPAPRKRGEPADRRPSREAIRGRARSASTSAAGLSA